MALVARSDGVNVDSLERAASLRAAFLPCAVNQNAPHRLGRGGEEVPPAVPFLGFVHIHKPDVGLMNQGRGLECLARLFLGQLGRRQLPQLVIDQGQELFGGERVALLDRGQDACDIAHRRHRKGERLCGPTSPNPREPGPAPLPGRCVSPVDAPGPFRNRGGNQGL